MGKILNKILQFSIPLLLLLIGLYLVPLKIFGPGLTNMLGDLGDARFNNYILEHGYKFLHGDVKSFWNVPMMYPYKNVIALSDNLLGTMPVYALFRSIGYDRETSFQCWIICLFALNFIFCYWALSKWTKNNILSATAAYIFAFGIYNIGHFDHVQVFPKFIAPFVLYWCWQFLSQQKLKYFLFAALGLVFQFYCGIYLGFFLIYALLFLIIAYFLVYRDWDFFLAFWNRKKIAWLIAIIGLSTILLSFLMLPYLGITKTTGLRQFASILSTLPRPVSYFFTHIASDNWYVFTQHSQFAFPDWWTHFHFVGGLPWIGILISIFLLFSPKIQKDSKRFITFLLLALFLNIAFCLNIGGYSLYKLMLIIPGFSSMRSIDRIVNIQIIFFLFVFVFAFNKLQQTYKLAKWLVFLLPLLVIIDNSINVGELKRFNKAESQSIVKEIETHIFSQYKPEYAAIAYMPIISKPAEPFQHNKTIELNISAMLAAQTLNIPIVNAYTGYYPGNYISFFDNLDQKNLFEWCNFTKCKIDDIQQINDISEKVEKIQLVFLKASNGKFVSVDMENQNLLKANKDHCLSWECFSLIKLKNGQCGLMSSENKLVAAEMESKNAIKADKTEMKLWETFTIQKIDDQHIAIRAMNGMFFSVDNNTTQLFASASSIGKNEIFELIYK
ncbi:MAG: hypothetical protein WCO13_00305 [Bacteroidota bacterium]